MCGLIKLEFLQKTIVTISDQILAATLVRYLLQQYQNMNILGFFWALMFVLCYVQGQQIQIDLQSTEATLYTNNKMLLKFKVKGANVPFSINYIGIPSDWSNIRNDLVISNITQQMVKEWTFDINITDSMRNNLYQTVKLSLNKYQVMLYPVTLAYAQNPSTAPFKSQAAPAQSLFNLTDLINRYPGLKQDGSAFSINYSANSIITPQLIANAQATYNPARDSKPITQFDIKKNAAINRQLNAAKAIANILTIIDRLSTSINLERNNLQQYQAQLKVSKEAVFNCSQQIFKIEDTKAKINNALEDRKTRFNQQKVLQDTSTTKLNQLKTNESVIKAKIQSIQKTINPNNNSEIDQIQSKIVQCKNEYKSSNNNIDNLNGKIKTNNLDINSIKDDISDSNKRLKDVNQSLDIVRAKITDLKKQLKEAQDLQQSLVKDQTYYSTVPIQGKTKIDMLQSKNKDFYNQIKSLDSQSKIILQRCQSQQKISLDLKQGIIKKQDNYNQLLEEINGIRKNIQTAESQIKQSLANSNSLDVQINALILQLQKYGPRLRQQNYLCSVTQQANKKIQAKIDQQNEKVRLDSTDLDSANLNLQRARAQKELADQAVQQYISVTANVTPYAIVPNGGSTILGGSPLGNNPAGAALGPAFRVDSIEKGSLQVNNMTTYLSTMYSMNIDPINLLSSVSAQQKSKSGQSKIDYNKLYPLDIQSRNQIISPLSVTSGLSNFNCEISGSLQTIAGILEQATLGSLVVRDTLNKKYTLSISTCTKILSTKPTNFFKTGGKIFFTGTEMFSLFGNTLFNAYTILCVPS